MCLLHERALLREFNPRGLLQIFTLWKICWRNNFDVVSSIEKCYSKSAAASLGDGRFFAVFLYGEGKENERTD